jgi:hypothetical protein
MTFSTLASLRASAVPRRGRLVLLLAAALAAAILSASAHSAHAAVGPCGPETFGVCEFESPAVAGEGGPPATQAGSHPYALTTTIVFNHETEEENEQFTPDRVTEEEVPNEVPEYLGRIYGEPKHIVTDLPPGLVVNPSVTATRCTEQQLETVPANGGGCPPGSAVGIATIYPMAASLGFLRSAVYNMVPPAGVPAAFGLKPGELAWIAHIVGGVRTGGDYGLSGVVNEVPQLKRLWAVKLTLWGNPSDPAHDRERGLCSLYTPALQGIQERLFKFRLEEAIANHKPVSEYPQEAGYGFNCPLPPHERSSAPFLTMPGSCTGSSLETSMSTYSWQRPEELIAPPPYQAPATTGCGELAFHPSLAVEPAPHGVGAESPSGLNVDLKIPQEESLETRAEADLKKAVVTLPEGMTLSPSSANGLGGCPATGPEGFNLHERETEVGGIKHPPAGHCPDSSKVGTVEVHTPLLEEPLTGAVYLAQPQCGGAAQPACTDESALNGELLRLYIEVEGHGAIVKLEGTVSANPATGRLTTTFDDNPQLPFNEFKLRFFTGPRAPLVTPASCGAYSTTSQLTPWSGTPPLELPSGFSIESGCSHPFSPNFAAGTANNQAGASSPFSLTFSRQDGEGRFAGLRVTAPPGLLATLRGVLPCPEPQAAEGTCGPQSEIGKTTVAAGPGPDPFWVRGGRVYLTGPYKGAPLGLSVVVPTVAGPFTLTGNAGPGEEVVRARIEVDPTTAQVTVISDPLPQIIEGIPLDLRTVNVSIDRPGFMINPTNCSQLAVTATLSSTEGASAALSNPFEAANCANLPFRPQLKLSLKGGTKRTGNPALKAVLTMQPGEANIASAQVTLPSSELVDNAHIGDVCTATEFAAGNGHGEMCKPSSIYGYARAWSPLLEAPLEGPVFLKTPGHKLPDLLAALNGQIDVALQGKVDTGKGGGIRNTFEVVPDAPVSKFVLSMQGGSKGLLVNSENLCSPKAKTHALANFTGQNGKLFDATPRVANSCKHHGRGGGARRH